MLHGYYNNKDKFCAYSTSNKIVFLRPNNYLIWSLPVLQRKVSYGWLVGGANLKSCKVKYRPCC